MLPIYIPTRGRIQRQKTLENLPKRLYPWTALVVDIEEYEQNIQAYEKICDDHKGIVIHCVPMEYRGIAMTRWFIGAKLCDRKRFVMLDDDLFFYHRKKLNDWHLIKNEPEDTFKMFEELNDKLHEYAHVSISMRQNNNAKNKLGVHGFENERYVRILGFQRKRFLQCEHGRVDIMEDFDVALQLLEKGYPSYVIYAYAQDQNQTQAKGGCSEYRTHKLHERSVRKMAKLHPKYVKLRMKKNKTGGEFGERLEATIQWKKAFEDSQHA